MAARGYQKEQAATLLTIYASSALTSLRYAKTGHHKVEQWAASNIASCTRLYYAICSIPTFPFSLRYSLILTRAEDLFICLRH